MEDRKHDAETAAGLVFVNTEHEKTDAETVAVLVFDKKENLKNDATNVAVLLYVKTIGVVHARTKNTMGIVCFVT